MESDTTFNKEFIKKNYQNEIKRVLLNDLNTNGYDTEISKLFKWVSLVLLFFNSLFTNLFIINLSYFKKSSRYVNKRNLYYIN